MLKPTRQAWALTQQSWAVIQSNKRFLVFPLTSIIFCMSLFILIATPLWKIERSYLDALSQQQTAHGAGWMFLILAIYFFICHFMNAFCGSALVVNARLYYENQPSPLRAGWLTALRHFIQLFVWTLIATTLGIIIRLIEAWTEGWHSNPWVQKYLAGMSWPFATYLVVPVTLFEKHHVINAIRRSSMLMSDTWGRAPKANSALGLILLALRIISLIPLFIAMHNGGHNALIVGTGITVLLWLSTSLLSSTTQILLVGACYEFATQGKIAHFDENTLRKAFASS